MKRDNHPWWLFITQHESWIATVEERARPEERIFIIRAKPAAQSLAWLIWGPVTAVVMVALLVGLAIGLDVRHQPGWMGRTVFIAALLVLPALAWLGTVLLMNRLSARYLQTKAQEYLIQLDQKKGLLIYRNPTEQKIAYADIEGVRTTHPIGEKGPSLRLTLDTKKGPVTLLDETIGVPVQKRELAREIQATLKAYQAG